jgi:copper resistance protein D
LTVTAIALARGLYYATTMMLFGATAFGALLRKRLPVIARPRLNIFRWTALMLAIGAAFVWLAMAAVQMADAMDGSIIAQTTTDTLFGQLFMARLAALLALAVTMAFSRNDRIAAILAAIALALPAATSHAAASSPAGFAAIGAILDATHLLMAGFWIGGLALLAALFARREPNMLLALSLFSDWAMIAVLLLVMTGLINAASIILGDKGHASPLYLAILGAKLALVLGMLGLATVNRFRLLPRLNTQQIARNVAFELGLGITAVLLAGALGQLQPTLGPQ